MKLLAFFPGDIKLAVPPFFESCELFVGTMKSFFFEEAALVVGEYSVFYLLLFLGLRLLGLFCRI